MAASSSASGSSSERSSRRRDRSDRRRQADAERRGFGDGPEALEREGEMRSSLVASEGVDLVDDDGLHRGEGGPGPIGGQVQIERLRRGDEEVWGPANHRLALPRGGIAGPHGDG